jgi:hypothetical protein
VTKEGGLEQNLKLVSQTPNHRGWRVPTSIEHRFQNLGNVHDIPRGVAEVRDSAGQVVSRGALNESSGAILPESFRRFQTPLVSVGQALLPGRYQIVTTYRYDGTDTTKTLKTYFWYIGSLIVWLAGVLGLGLVAAAAWWWRRRLGRKGRHS